MSRTITEKYPEVNEIKGDFESLRGDAVGLAQHIRQRQHGAN